MLQRALGGGKLPRNSIFAFCGRNGSSGCLSVAGISFIFMCVGVICKDVSSRLLCIFLEFGSSAIYGLQGHELKMEVLVP